MYVKPPARLGVIIPIKSGNLIGLLLWKRYNLVRLNSFKMCLNPIRIKTPSKIISLDNREPLFYDVPCGQCAECRRLYSLQWYYRAMKHFEYLLETPGSYCLFDTLTYDNEHLPHLSDFMKVESDFPCFNPEDYRLFMVRLRRRLEKKGYDVNGNLSQFLVSEYGTSPNCSHRPHYHIIFYVSGSLGLHPIELSKMIDSCWKKGRTDGVNYNGSFYVMNRRVFDAVNPQSSYNIISYVSKYVMKSCEFQRELDKRIGIVFSEECKKHPDKWSKSRFAKSFLIRLKNLVNQFHRQSDGFGESVLRDMDFSDFDNLRTLKIFHPDKIVIRVPLPMYYKRKIFYDLVDYSGFKSWQINDLGKAFRQYVHDDTIFLLSKRLKEVDLNNNRQLSSMLNSRSFDDLSVYVVDYKGRIQYDCLKIQNIDDKVLGDFIFNYNSKSDVGYFGFSFTSKTYLGSCTSFYSPLDNERLDDLSTIPIIDDSYKDSFQGFDAILDLYYKLMLPYNNMCNTTMVESERLRNVHKQFLRI